MTLLSVNLNKVALLRNARGENEPNLLHAAQTCINAGCGGITVHPRPDQRHIRPDDVRALAELLRDRVEYNIEGNPFALPRGSYPGLLALVRETRPSQVTLVPDHDSQLTSDHGFDLHADARRLHPLVTELRALDCRVSLFVDPGPLDAECARALGITRVELHTGPYAHAFDSGSIEHSLEHYMVTARSARHAGLLINAGHDLNQANLGTFHAALPELAEVSIGHALIAEALYEGLETTVRHYLDILRLRRS